MYPVKLAKSIPCEAEREKKKHGCHDDPNATNLKPKLTNNPAAEVAVKASIWQEPAEGTWTPSNKSIISHESCSENVYFFLLLLFPLVQRVLQVGEENILLPVWERLPLAEAGPQHWRCILHWKVYSGLSLSVTTSSVHTAQGVQFGL